MPTSHELLPVDLVGLIENASDLVFVPFQLLDSASELIANVQLMGVEEQQNQVASRNANVVVHFLMFRRHVPNKNQGRH